MRAWHVSLPLPLPLPLPACARAHVSKSWHGVETQQHPRDSRSYVSGVPVHTRWCCVWSPRDRPPAHGNTRQGRRHGWFTCRVEPPQGRQRTAGNTARRQLRALPLRRDGARPVVGQGGTRARANEATLMKQSANRPAKGSSHLDGNKACRRPTPTRHGSMAPGASCCVTRCPTVRACCAHASCGPWLGMWLNLKRCLNETGFDAF